MRQAMCKCIGEVCSTTRLALPKNGHGADNYKISSTHITFNQQAEWDRLSELGFLQRSGIQYHWDNPGYPSFDDFLGTLKQSKRKNIRQASLVQSMELHRESLIKDPAGSGLHPAQKLYNCQSQACNPSMHSH